MAAELTPTDLAIFGSGGGSIDLAGIAGRSERGSPPTSRARRRSPQGGGPIVIPPTVPQMDTGGDDTGKYIYSQLHSTATLTLSLSQE